MYRNRLPQLDGDLFLTDSGLETVLIFLEGVELPLFAAFVLLDSEEGRECLRRYYRRHMSIAEEAGLGFVGESATWRANPDWATQLGYDTAALDRLNRESIGLLVALRDDFGPPFVISGCVGPRGDGHSPETLMTPDEAERYHAEQIGTFGGVRSPAAPWARSANRYFAPGDTDPSTGLFHGGIRPNDVGAVRHGQHATVDAPHQFADVAFGDLLRRHGAFIMVGALVLAGALPDCLCAGFMSEGDGGPIGFEGAGTRPVEQAVAAGDNDLDVRREGTVGGEGDVREALVPQGLHIGSPGAVERSSRFVVAAIAASRNDQHHYDHCAEKRSYPGPLHSYPLPSHSRRWSFLWVLAPVDGPRRLRLVSIRKEKVLV
jgi:Homocysteine S-methyltransferase